MIRIRVCIQNADPDPATQINADPDPDPQSWFQLVILENWNSFLKLVLLFSQAFSSVGLSFFVSWTSFSWVFFSTDHQFK
jgi:hypothetical protein